MDVKIHTGKIFYQVDNTVAAILIEMFPAAIEKLNLRPQPTPAELEPRWYVCKTISNDKLYYISFKQGARAMSYDGPPSQAVAAFTKIGAVMPAQILADYRQLWAPREGAPEAWWAEYAELKRK